jgi:hypothetical protein
MFLASCDGGQTTGVQNAKGDTPAKYVVCGQSESNCFVAARFKDLQSCQSHKELADMLCDRKSDPGSVVCRKDTAPAMGVAYCTL